ncbi:MAG: serine hydroxymethyltransferase [Helicobacteraceae bacterium]|jgi:glycine hydroxymethyltransferase|nr:serine hydroxymethyltransferase [Helicobacteraceae bacterium]
MGYLQTEDKEIFDWIEKELGRQNDHLEMIASENYTFPAVMEAMGSVLTNKYAEGYPRKRYYGGCEFVDEIEQIAIDRVKRLFGASFANVQPHSGSSANAAVYAALLKPYDKILGMDLSHGGHLTHGAKVSFTGQNYHSFSYGVNENGLIDYDEVEKIALSVKPQIIVAGFSAYSRELDFARFRAIADRVGAFLFSDIAHVAGLVCAGEYPSPFPHSHIVTTTTHKTLRGPRGGAVLTNDEEIAKKIDKAVFPGLQGGPLMHVIAAKAVGFGYNLKPEWKSYAKQVKANIKALAQVALKRGFNVVSGGTDNHLILMSFLDRAFSGKDADNALGRAGICVNKNTVPGETRSPFITSGVRIGSAALTSRGMKEEEFKFIGEKISDILDDIANEKRQIAISEEIKALSKRFTVYSQATF